jgi:opacity protein-like surface antigen
MEDHVMTSLLIVVILLLTPSLVRAQLPDSAGPGTPFVFGGVGFGTTWDDEGLLGRGLGVSGGAGVMLTPTIGLAAFVDRVRYYRDVEWLTFDGRVVFAGGELSWRVDGRGMSPYLTIGAGAMNDSGTWVRKTRVGTGQSRIDETIERRGTKAALTASGGIDIPASETLSIRAGVRFYGLLQTGDDLFPHLVLQPTAAAILRF